MAKMTKKKFNLVLLFIIAIAVWGSNGYRMIKGITLGDSSGAMPEVKTGQVQLNLLSDSLASWEYPKSGRDPFFLTVQKTVAKSVSAPKRKKPEIIPPRLLLTGIILDHNERVAVIETPDRNVHFLKEKAELDSLVIDKIAEKHIVVKYKRKTFEYSL